MSFLVRPNLASPFGRPIAEPVPFRSAAFPYKCLELDGAGYVSHADDPALHVGVGDFMWEMWIKKDASNQANAGIVSTWGGNGGWFIECDVVNNPSLRILIKSSISGYFDHTISGFFSDSWVFLFMACDRSGNMSIYKQGILENAEDISGYAGDFSGSGLFLGRRTNNIQGEIALGNLWYLGLNGFPAGAGNTPADYAIWRYANPYAPLNQFNAGGWSGYANADRGEALNETDFVTHAKWDVTNDFNDVGGNAHYTWSANQTSLLTQTAGNRAKAGSNSHYFELTYTVAVTLAPDGDFALTLTSAFANSSTILPFTAGTHRVVFRSATAASAADFVIQAVSGTDTQGEFTIDDIFLTETGVCGTWPMDGDLLDRDIHHVAGANGLDLTEGGSGNRFVPSTV